MAESSDNVSQPSKAAAEEQDDELEEEKRQPGSPSESAQDTDGEESKVEGSRESQLRAELKELTQVIEDLEKYTSETAKKEETRKSELLKAQREVEDENSKKLEKLKMKEKELLKAKEKGDAEDAESLEESLGKIKDNLTEVSVQLARTSEEFLRRFTQLEAEYEVNKLKNLQVIEEHRKKKEKLEKTLNPGGEEVTSLEPDLTDTDNPDVLFADCSKKDQKKEPMDWKANRKAIVCQMNKIAAPKSEKSEESLKQIGPYEISKEVVGYTYISTSFKAKSTKNKTPYAAKVIDFKEIDPFYVKHLQNNSFKILWFVKTVPFKNMCEIVDYYMVNDQTFIVIEEHLKLSVEAMIQQLGPRKEKDTRTYSAGLADAINFLHNAGIAHQNIAAFNVYVLPMKRTIKLAAIEYAMIYLDTESESIRLQHFKQKIKAGRFVPPEISDGLAYDPTKVDVYSYGTMIYYLAIGRYPYDGERDLPKEEQFAQSKAEFKKVMSRAAQQLIEKCIQTNPNDRIDIRQVVEDPWFSESIC